MYSHRIVLHFPKQVIEQPLICHMARRYDVDFSVLRAEIAEDAGGTMVLGLRGHETAVREALGYLEEQGVSIEPLRQDIRLDEDRCIQCGVCVGQCPTEALYVEAGTRRVRFDAEKCIACQQCVPACPVHAIFVTFK